MFTDLVVADFAYCGCLMGFGVCGVFFVVAVNSVAC